MGLYVYRMLGAAVLDAGMYEGIENDRRTTVQAVLTVVLASLAAGVGAGEILGTRAVTLATITALALITWCAWAMLILQIGTRALPGPATQADWGQLLRTTGFAASPGLLQIFGLMGQARGWVFAMTGIWMFAAMVVGVKHALDYESGFRALLVCAIAIALIAVLAFGISVLVARPVY
jgi:hypothetical protein